MDLKSILNKTKSDFISVSDVEGNVIEFTERQEFEYKKEVSLGGNFFFKSASDFFEKVLNENNIEQVNLSSEDTNILFIKNSSQELVFTIYSKNEINPSIIKFLINKYARHN